MALGTIHERKRDPDLDLRGGVRLGFLGTCVICYKLQKTEGDPGCDWRGEDTRLGFLAVDPQRLGTANRRGKGVQVVTREEGGKKQTEASQHLQKFLSVQPARQTGRKIQAVTRGEEAV